MANSTSWILSLVSKQASKDNSVVLGQNQQNLKSQEKTGQATLKKKSCKEKESKAPVSQLVNAEANSDNRKVVLTSNYATRIHGRH